MGVDACLFATKAKKYYYYDREKNISPYFAYEDPLEEYIDLFKKLKFCYNDEIIGLNNQDAIKLLEYVRFGWASKGPLNGRDGWALSLIKFVNAHPNDTFVSINDSGDFEVYCKWKEMCEEVKEDAYD